MQFAQKLVEHNKMSDRIDVLAGKMEEMSLPEQVDVIIAEWMGTLLLVTHLLGYLPTFLHLELIHDYQRKVL